MRNPHKASRVNKGPEADNRFTPRALVKALHEEFHFTVDVAGHPLAPATEIIGNVWTFPTVDGVIRSWARHRVWCNPPFSDIAAWVRKAHTEVCVHRQCPLVVMLLPWNRQEQGWWQQYIEPWRDTPGYAGDSTIQTIALGGGKYGAVGRVKYGTPEDPEGRHHKNSPNFGSGLVIWRVT